jgi:hypothetical protein
MKRFIDVCGRPAYLSNIKGISKTYPKPPKILFREWDRGNSRPGHASLFSSAE